VIRERAATGHPNYLALMPLAAELDQAADYVETLPESFWCQE
jgi:hypothetical protein